METGAYTTLIPVATLVEGISLFMQILGVRDQPTVRDALEARLTQLEEEQKLEAVLEFLSDPRITLDREAQTLRAHVGDGVVEFRGEPRQVALSCSDATHRILTRSIPGLAVPGGERSAVDASIACHD